MSTAKKPRGAVFAVRDFLLRYQCSREQNAVLIALSLFAPTIRPGRDNLQRLARIRSEELTPAIDFWRGLGVVTLVAEARPKYAAEYRIDLDRMAALLGSPTEPNGSGGLGSTAEPSYAGNSVPQRNRDKQTHSVPDPPDSVPEPSRLGSHMPKNPPNSVPLGNRKRSTSRGNPPRAAAEEDALRAKFLAAAAAIDDAFAILSTGEPYGSPEFQLEWLAAVDDSPNHAGDVRTKEYPFMHTWLPSAIERLIQSCHRKGISIPKPVYRDKRMAEEARATHCR